MDNNIYESACGAIVSVFKSRMIKVSGRGGGWGVLLSSVFKFEPGCRSWWCKSVSQQMSMEDSQLPSPVGVRPLVLGVDPSRFEVVLQPLLTRVEGRTDSIKSQ